MTNNNNLIRMNKIEKGEDVKMGNTVERKLEVSLTEDVKRMVSSIFKCLGDHDTISVMGNSLFTEITKENIDLFMTGVNAGLYNNCRIMIDYDDEDSTLVIAFIGLTAANAVNINKPEEKKEEEVKMNNQTTEVKVENKGVVKMVAKNDMGIVKKFDGAVMEAAVVGVKPVINVTVEDKLNVVTLTKNNMGLIREALRTHQWAGICEGAVDFMFFHYEIVDGMFSLKLSANRIEKKQDTSFTMTTPAVHPNNIGKTKEEIEKSTEEFNESLKAAGELLKMAYAVDENNDMEEIEPGEVANYVQEKKFPNAMILSEAGGNISGDRYEKLAASCPTTGIDTADKFQRAVMPIIQSAVGTKIDTKIKTEDMLFLNLKAYMDKGMGKEYKQVSVSWIFRILDSANFMILSGVPNKTVLKSIMKNGLIVSVKVGTKIVGTDPMTGKDITEDIMEERLFKYVANSASKQRQERYIFTCYADRENIRKMLTFWSSDFDFGKKTVIAKADSRVGQNLSTGVVVGGAMPYNKRAQYANTTWGRNTEFSYIVMPDLTVGDLKTMRGEVATKEDFEKVLPDGAGVCTMAAAKLLQEKLRNPNAVLFQTRLGKGTFFPQPDEDIVDMCKYFNIDADPTQPIVFVSESMWKFSVGIDIIPFVILRASEQMSQKAFICYETLNALNISSEAGTKAIKDLAVEEFNFFHLTKESDPALFVHRLGTLAKVNAEDGSLDEQDDIMEDDTLATSLFRFFYANPEFARRSEYLVAQVNNLFARKIADMARGKLMVDGSFCIMMLDPGIYTGKTKLKAGQVYVGGRTGKCLLARYPMVFMSEPQVMEAVDIPEFAMFKGLNIIIMNAYDFAWEKMQGADFDGDACLVTFDQRLIDLVVTGLESPQQVKKEAPKTILNWDSLTDYYVKNFEVMHPEDPRYVATIGKANNIVAAMLSTAHANGTFLNDETIRRASELAVVINDLIDAAKTGVMPELDKWYFDTYKVLPNWLAKSRKVGRNFINTWEVPTIDEDPESIYRKDVKSPLGRLANNLVPYLFNQFQVVGGTPFKTEDMVGIYNGATIMLAESQIKGIHQDYINQATFIFSENNTIIDEKERSLQFQALCAECNERIRKVAASYDMITVAVACLRVGRARGFAFKCFEEGVIAVFESLSGKKYVKIDAEREIAADIVTKVVEGTRYMVIDRAEKTTQVDKFSNANVGKEVTIRLVGINFDDIPVNSMNDLKKAIAASNTLIRGGRDYSGHHVAFAGATPIGRITLEREFCASSDFAQGGYAEVLDVKFVRTKDEKNMSPAQFLASKNFDAPIKFADLVVRYVAGPNGDTSVEEEISCMQGLGVESFLLPTMPGSAPITAGVNAPAPSMEGEMSQEDALKLAGSLAKMFGFQLTPATEQPKVEEKKETVVEDKKWPDMLPMSEDDGYWSSLMDEAEVAPTTIINSAPVWPGMPMNK